MMKICKDEIKEDIKSLLVENNTAIYEKVILTDQIEALLKLKPAH